MSACDVCQEQLLDFVTGELDRAEQRAVAEHLADCDLCPAVEADLRRGLALASALPLEAPPEAAMRAVMRAARVRSGEASTSTSASASASTSMLPMALTGRWGRVRAFLVRPQFVMATVMLLAVAFGAWYVPRRAEQRRLADLAAPSTPVIADTGDVVSPDDELPPSETTPVTPLEPSVVALGPAARLERGLQAYGRSDYVAAIDELNAVVSAPAVSEASWTTAMHHLARSYQQNGDCPSATRRYEQLFRRSPAYNQASQAMLEAGTCYRALGNELRARELLELAAEDPATRDAARSELSELGPPRNRRPTRAPAPNRLGAPASDEPSSHPSRSYDSPY
ncbi:MAG: hypothetical protein R3B40_12250 [Polyangiales bacterium]